MNTKKPVGHDGLKKIYLSQIIARKGYAMTPEKKVENQIKRYLENLGAYHVKIHGSAYMPAGTPDILACVSGRFVGIEVKKPKGGIVSALQKLKIKQIRNAGGVALVATSVEEVEREFEKEGFL